MDWIKSLRAIPVWAKRTNRRMPNKIQVFDQFSVCKYILHVFPKILSYPRHRLLCRMPLEQISWLENGVAHITWHWPVYTVFTWSADLLVSTVWWSNSFSLILVYFSFILVLFSPFPLFVLLSYTLSAGRKMMIWEVLLYKIFKGVLIFHFRCFISFHWVIRGEKNWNIVYIMKNYWLLIFVMSKLWIRHWILHCLWWCAKWMKPSHD